MERKVSITAELINKEELVKKDYNASDDHSKDLWLKPNNALRLRNEFKSKSRFVF